MERKNDNGPLRLYFVILAVFSTVFETLIIVRREDVLYAPLMWTPALAALAANCLIAFRAEKRTGILGLLRQGGFRRCGVRYILLGCLLPLLYLLIPYMIYWKLYPDSFAYTGVALATIWKDLVPVAVIGIFLSMVTAIGEEIGWRGFMVPELYKRLGLNKTLGLSSLIWCVWHLPLLAFGDYMEGTPLWYRLVAFILCIFPVGVMAGLLALRSGSLWPAAFLHAAHNNYDQVVFGVITRGDNCMYFVSETGVLTIVCAWMLAILLYRRTAGKLKETEEKQE